MILMITEVIRGIMIMHDKSKTEDASNHNKNANTSKKNHDEETPIVLIMMRMRGRIFSSMMMMRGYSIRVIMVRRIAVVMILRRRSI